MSDALSRFGKGWIVKLGQEKQIVVDIGEAVASCGPGDGFALLPWALDRYEAALRLRPGETWLLKRMLKFAWEFHNQAVFVSLRKISIESGVSRVTLHKWRDDLHSKGLIRRLGPAPGDRRIRYDMQPLFVHLAICAAVDPTSGWAKKHGPVALTHVPDWARAAIDFEAIKALERVRS